MQNKFIPLSDEQVDDLQNNGLFILQKKSGFRFGMDSILLKDFTRIKPNDHVADLGTGSAILPILLSQKECSSRFSAFEWQADIAEMATRSVKYNQLADRIKVYNADLRSAHTMIGREGTDVVVCNPPYGKKHSVLTNENLNKRISRHETDCSINEIIEESSLILKNKGRMYIVFPPHRLLELLDGLRQYRLEPKHIRLVYGKASKSPYLLLTEAIKNAKPMLHFMPPLIVHHEDGEETEEIKQIYLNRM